VRRAYPGGRRDALPPFLVVCAPAGATPDAPGSRRLNVARSEVLRGRVHRSVLPSTMSSIAAVTAARTASGRAARITAGRCAGSRAAAVATSLARSGSKPPSRADRAAPGAAPPSENAVFGASGAACSSPLGVSKGRESRFPALLAALVPDRPPRYAVCSCSPEANGGNRPGVRQYSIPP